MAELKVGTIVDWHHLSTILVTFRLMPARGSRFPDYDAGQYIALRRDDSRLTKRIADQDGVVHYVTDRDESGHPKHGSVTHSYSIASAPFETRDRGYLEFYVILEQDELGEPGRLTESLFRIGPESGAALTYVDRIVGDFTLAKRAAGFRNVLWVGTGTGVAPFVSMIKELHFKAAQGAPLDGVQYTLLHANRTTEELGYHEDLLRIEASRCFDFVYIPTVSRPTSRDLENPGLGRGRANNVLRHLLGMPPKEQHGLVAPALPRHIAPDDMRQRLEAGRTVILTCGNPSLMEDIKYIADNNQIRFEKEDW
jgi:ferredoxin-NADP reductase